MNTPELGRDEERGHEAALEPRTVRRHSRTGRRLLRAAHDGVGESHGYHEMLKVAMKRMRFGVVAWSIVCAVVAALLTFDSGSRPR